MRVVIAGATGFIGRALCESLHQDYEVVALSRNSEKAERSIGHLARVVQWDGRSTGGWTGEVEDALGVVNLAGESVASGRWTGSKKFRILQSRLDAAKAIAGAVKKAERRPKVLVQASAIGYYGRQRDELLDESSPGGEGYLAGVCRGVESIADTVKGSGARLAVVRTGIVLGPDGGALAELVKPFRFHLGGYLGDGRQWFSWISLKDEVSAIRFLIENESSHGVFNLTAPEPVTMERLCKSVGAILGRRTWLAVPGYLARLAFGEKADEMLLSSLKVAPKRLLEAGFEFEHSDIEDALKVAIEG
ncbi:MAG: TIGR01777 family oxidoreductase [Phycisphaerales bacterium]|nr:MAG: TIGR01777 family oxidoreductase [Phycisphaerales bacterium]